MSPLPRALPRRDLLKLAGGMVTAGALAGTSGCGLLGGSAAQQGGNAQIEKPNLRIGALPTSELAPLHLAAQNGHFQREGLTVEIINAADGAAALNSTIGGDYDITFSSYVPIFAAQARGIAQLKILADGASSVPNTCMIMAAPTSRVRTPRDLAGKTIGVSGTGTMSELMVKAALRAHGMNPDNFKPLPIGFPNMPNALRTNQVDAAFVTEPFLTLAARDAGAIPVVDTATGPLDDLPLGGYASSAEFAEKNPRTVAAFQRAMDTAVAEAQDRTKVEPLLPRFARIDAQTASIITLLKTNSRADATRLQRVPRLMLQFGYIQKDVSAASMIIAPPQG